MTKIRAISLEAAKAQAALFALADYGYSCDSEGFKWYVYIYMM